MALQNSQAWKFTPSTSYPMGTFGSTESSTLDEICLVRTTVLFRQASRIHASRSPNGTYSSKNSLCNCFETVLMSYAYERPAVRAHKIYSNLLTPCNLQVSQAQVLMGQTPGTSHFLICSSLSKPLN